MVGKRPLLWKCVIKSNKIKAISVSALWFCGSCGLGGIQCFYALENPCFFFSEGRWNKKGKEITWKLDIFKFALSAALANR
jgi:hypothetical protein